MNLTIDHVSQDDDSLVLLGKDGHVYRPGDQLPSGETAYEWVASHVSDVDPLRDQFLQQYVEERFLINSLA